MPYLSPRYQIESDQYGRFSVVLPTGAYIVSATAADAIELVTCEISAQSDQTESIALNLSRQKSLQFVIVNENHEPVPFGKTLFVCCTWNFTQKGNTLSFPLTVIFLMKTLAIRVEQFFLSPIIPGGLLPNRSSVRLCRFY